MWQILAAGAAGLSAVGQIAAGQAQQQASQLNAFNIKTDKKFLRPEELEDLKGDSNKLKITTNWEPEYTFESMLDEMINYWDEVL